MILANSTSRIAAALLVMRDIKFKFDVARIGCLHDPIYFIRGFPQARHVIVIADRYAQIDGSLADFSQHSSELLKISSLGLSSLGSG